MGKYTQTIKKYTDDLTQIRNTLNGKLGGGCSSLKFSQVADKIREIETGPPTYTLKIYSDGIGFTGWGTMTIKLQDNDTKQTIIEQTVKEVSGVIEQEYPFETKAKDIYYEIEAGISRADTLYGLPGHKGIYCDISGSPNVEFYDG